MKLVAQVTTAFLFAGVVFQLSGSEVAAMVAVQLAVVGAFMTLLHALLD